MTIQKIIKDRGFTIQAVADRMQSNRGHVGISQGSLSTILNKGKLTTSTLRDIAGIIGLSLAELVILMEDYTPCGSGLVGYINYNGEDHVLKSMQDVRDFLSKYDSPESVSPLPSSEPNEE